METTHPLPKARRTITITYPGGFARYCPGCKGSRAWATTRSAGTCIYQPNDDGVECGTPYTEADWTERPARTMTGRVVKTGTSITDRPLVYIKQEGERFSDAIAWDEVLTVEVHS